MPLLLTFIARPGQALKRVSEHRETSAKEMPSSIMSVARCEPGLPFYIGAYILGHDRGFKESTS
jgi:hypothetical protein